MWGAKPGLGLMQEVSKLCQCEEEDLHWDCYSLFSPLLDRRCIVTICITFAILRDLKKAPISYRMSKD